MDQTILLNFPKSYEDGDAEAMSSIICRKLNELGISHNGFDFYVTVEYQEKEEG